MYVNHWANFLKNSDTFRSPTSPIIVTHHRLSCDVGLTKSHISKMARFNKGQGGVSGQEAEITKNYFVDSVVETQAIFTQARFNVKLDDALQSNVHAHANKILYTHKLNMIPSGNWHVLCGDFCQYPPFLSSEFSSVEERYTLESGG